MHVFLSFDVIIDSIYGAIIQKNLTVPIQKLKKDHLNLFDMQVTINLKLTGKPSLTPAENLGSEIAIV